LRGSDSYRAYCRGKRLQQRLFSQLFLKLRIRLSECAQEYTEEEEGEG
jgi:hypothetical protein